jgi:hypothetical protein
VILKFYYLIHEPVMKKISLIAVMVLHLCLVYSQENTLYQNGLTAEQNLKAIGSLAPYSTGGVGFDTRYEGVKGSPGLFDKLQMSLLLINGQKTYIQLETNLDLVTNVLLFNYPKTGKLMALPSKMVKEVRIKSEGKEIVFKVSGPDEFEREIKEGRFYQLLMEGKFVFIKVPIKKLIEADYKAVYSPDRRYDEYTTYYKYYLRGADSIFHQIQLNKKSLIRFFPDKKDLIRNTIESKTYESDEDMVINVLSHL